LGDLLARNRFALAHWFHGLIAHCLY
jgi:hypothetical protein